MRRATPMALACALALGSAGCSAIYSFDEFHVGNADASMPDGALPDATTPDGGDAGPRDAGTDAGLICPATRGDCDGDAVSCETDLTTSRSNCGACGARNACVATDGCWAGTCDTVDKLVLGHSHACALLGSQRVVCWGSNSRGQLGNGTRTSSERPVVVNLGEDATDVAAGALHSCALLKDSKTIRCWGANAWGEAGVALHEDQLVPAPEIRVPTSGDFTKVTAGIAHTCGLSSAGRVYCWGSNLANQLRAGATTQSDAPLLVPALPAGVEAVEAGGSTTCAVAGGLVYCWGLDDHGQRGTSAPDTMAAPVRTELMADLTGVASISVGLSHACAVTGGGALYCWGSNASGEIGNRATSDQRSAYQVVTVGVTSVGAGAASTCAIEDTGTYCWGSNKDGQARSTPDDAPHTGPTELAGLVLPTRAVVAHEWRTVCAVGTDGVTCWGNDAWGQAGRQTEPLQQPVPRDVDGLTGVTALAAGTDHACAVHSGNAASCWGVNEGGQLGDGTRRARSTPGAVAWTARPTAVTEIAAGDFHSCATGVAGGGALSAWCWGSNLAGELGNGMTSPSLSPVTVLGTMMPSGLAASSRHTCATSTDMLHLQCWGSNPYGEAGGMAGTAVLTAGDVTGLPAMMPVTSVAAGGEHTCAVVASNVFCLGHNPDGLLGLTPTTTETFSTATQVTGATNAVAIAGGDGFTCLRAVDGSVSCWGRGDRGQLGDGLLANRRSPAPTLPLGGAVSAIAAGAAHVCVVAAAGAGTHVVCWGANDEGQAGSATLGVVATPTAIPGSDGIVELAAGSDFTCGRRMTGAVACWGSRAAGRLADAITLFEPTAAPPYWSP